MAKGLILMCGPSGGGKSTWVHDCLIANKGEIPIYHISRDGVRFAMLADNDDYFAKEDEVFKEWIRQIQEHLDSDEDCYIVADATHLNERSRNKTLNALKLPEKVDIIAVNVNPPLNICLARNEQRTGRALVPRSVIKRMYFSYEAPHNKEKYHYHQILTVQENDE